MGLWEMVEVGSPFTLGLLCCGAVSWPLGLASAVTGFATKNRRLPIGLGAASILMGMGAFASGLFGYFLFASRVEAAVAFADPENRAVMEAVGREEALIPLLFGIGAAVVPLLLGGVAVARGVLSKAPAAPEP